MRRSQRSSTGEGGDPVLFPGMDLFPQGQLYGGGRLELAAPGSGLMCPHGSVCLGVFILLVLVSRKRDACCRYQSQASRGQRLRDSHVKGTLSAALSAAPSAASTTNSLAFQEQNRPLLPQ